MRNRGNGFTLVEIMIVIAIVGLLAALAVANFVKARNTTREKVCLTTVHGIARAYEQYVLEFNIDAPSLEDKTQVNLSTEIIGSTNYIKDAPSCPTGGTLSAGANDTSGIIWGCCSNHGYTTPVSEFGQTEP